MEQRDTEQFNLVEDNEFLEAFLTDESTIEQVTLDLARSPLVLLNYAATHYIQSTSTIFRKKFGIGSTDWRLLVVLFRNPRSSSKDIEGYVRMNKAAISRALAVLTDRGFVIYTSAANDERIKIWSLTSSGIQLHNEMLQVSVSIYRHVLYGLDYQDIEHLRISLNKIAKRIASLPEQFPISSFESK